MNCVEFCKKALADPKKLPPEMMAHLNACQNCAGFVQEIEAFDNELLNAVEISVPPAFDETILKATKHYIQKEQQWARQTLYSFAAILLLTVSVVLFTNVRTPISLDTLIISHIEKEPIAFETNMLPTHQTIVGTLAPMQIQVTGLLPNVQFVKQCRIGKGLGGHLVLAGEKGPVTLIILPLESTSYKNIFVEDKYQGWIKPLPGGGIIAMIGPPGENLTDLWQTIQSAIFLNV